MNLDSPISDLPKVGPILSKKFEKLGVKTVSDLFNHVPTRYVDYSKLSHINSLRAGETATIHAKVVSIANVFSKKGVRMQIGSVEDETGRLQVVWFNQPFLVRMLYPGKMVSVSGKVGFFNRKICLTSPDYEILDPDEGPTLHTGRLLPIYPETSGLSSKWIRRIIKNAHEAVTINEFLPDEYLERLNLARLGNAIKLIHFPQTLEEAEEGKKRLGFDELLFMHLKTLYRKADWEKNKVSGRLAVNGSAVNQFISSLPFKLTDSQKTAIDEILSDMSKPIPMNRLLEGDVGSGKTVVAAVGMFAAFVNGYQSILMAPTQILAEQHFETLNKLFKNHKIKIGILTSSLPNGKWNSFATRQFDILVGTHALIYSKINLNKVAFVVIDEQHRFGVEQRIHLVKKSGTPHVLTMTATPIPRTVALASYGDLDLSILKEMPKGRLKVTTWVVPEQKREKAYEWIKSKIKNQKSKVFIVCPLIEDSETETLADVKSVTSEFEKLKKVFSEFKLGLLHGRLKPKEKNKVLDGFRSQKIDILVTTPVVEVGIDIPNAEVAVIESAERFGLASLHQLRGRVGRGEKKSYCLLFSNFHSGSAFQRLKKLEKVYSGFELAELDLRLRGPGEIFGSLQSGFRELKIANWSDIEMVKKTKDLAEKIIKNPKKFPLINYKAPEVPI